MRHISAAGLKLIKGYEGFRSLPYRDAVGVWTIGYGETQNVGPGTAHVSEAQATAALERRVRADYEPYIHRLGVAFNQNQFDALVSVIYNLGPGVLDAGRSLGDALRRKPLSVGAVQSAIKLYDKAGGHALPGLTRRRAEEAALFGKPGTVDKARIAKLQKQAAAIKLRITSDKKRLSRINRTIRRLQAA